MHLLPPSHPLRHARALHAPTAHGPTRWAAGVLVSLLTLSLFATTAVVPSQAASAAQRALQVGPEIYVGGQAVTFDGALGRSGEQRVHLQMHMNRPGDTWKDLPGTASVTDAQGAFLIVQPAPAMFNVSYRVVSAREASPSFNFRARSQEIVLTHSAANPGRTFTITADTAPLLRGGGLDLTPPVFAGRTLTLQERTGTTWSNLDTTTVDNVGRGEFEVTAPDTGAEPVYRVRAEDYFEGANRIGWFPSFPLVVPLRGSSADRPSAQPVDETADHSAEARTSTARQSTSAQSRRRGGSTNASQAYSWGPSRFDFAWEFGESLTSNAYRGTRRSGRWEDSSDGTGRAVHFNGGLALQSQRLRSDLSDRGTTAATLQGNAQRTGRWEFRLRSLVEERGSRPYRALIQLVDESAGTAACTPTAITVADFTLGSSGMDVGVTSARTSSQWQSRINGFTLDEDAINVAVEVGRKHISWFADGRLVATVRGKSANPGGSLTPRLSLVGEEGKEMNASMLISDWQRAWTLDRGRQVKGGAGLTRSAYASSC